MLYPTDLEPEYASINDNNVAVVTLQENNEIVQVDLATGKVTRDFTAGKVSLTQIDLTEAPRPNQVNLSESLVDRLREPDGVTWVSTSHFLTASEVDMDGGSRRFTLFNTDRSVAYDARNTMEHLMARIGHANDKRSRVLAVYDLSKANAPAFKQVLPSAQAPEGVLTIPSRNLVSTASEATTPAVGGPVVFAALSIYLYQKAAPQYPTIESANRVDGTPIPWSALSGLAPASMGSLVCAIDDSFFKGNASLRSTPASSRPSCSAKSASPIRTARLRRWPRCCLPSRMTRPLMPPICPPWSTLTRASTSTPKEGISVASTGGFWIASEGAGGVTANNVKSGNLIFKVSATGVIEDIIQLPADLNAKQTNNGYEGIAESDDKLVVALPARLDGGPSSTHRRVRPHGQDLVLLVKSTRPHHVGQRTWLRRTVRHHALGNNRFDVIERDYQASPDAAIKMIYRIGMTGMDDGSILTKTKVRDVLPDLRATKRWRCS